MSVKQIGSRSGPTFCPDLGPICLQRLSADDTQWAKVNYVSVGLALAP